eukprot:Nk52_evm38s221 gene=Nk52_evmTU38s221
MKMNVKSGKGKGLLLAAFLLLGSVLCVQAASEYQMTVMVDSGDMVCVYENIKAGLPYSVDFQVIAGGALDIDISLFTPHGGMVVYQLAQTDGVYHRTAEEEGDYKLCFGNSMSTVTEKWVYFEFSVDPENEYADFDKEAASGSQDHEYDTLIGKTTTIRQHLHDTSHTQMYLRYRESRHRHTAESTNERVMMWSIMECAVLVGMAVLQVHFVKQFFKTEKRRINF